jgi:hypothetical protein
MKRCTTCQESQFAPKPSLAKCGHKTAFAGAKLCRDCAKKDAACEGCGAALTPAQPDDEYVLPPHTD